MSLKNGALGVPAGGAKGGIDLDPKSPHARAVLTRFVRDMRPLLESYWATAEDLGVNQELLDEVFAEVGLGLSVVAALRRNPDPAAAERRMREALAATTDGYPVAAVAGGYGVAAATLAALSRDGAAPDRTTAVIQGFGSMGGATARYLARAGVRIVGVVDAQGAVVNPDGLDVERLLAARNAFGEIDRAALRAGDRPRPREEWLDIRCDVLIPAAVGDVLTGANAAQVRAPYVVEAANLPSTPEARDELHARGVIVVPDFVANAGTNAWFWWTMLGELPPGTAVAFPRLEQTMRIAVRSVLDTAARESISPREAAERVALDTLARMEAARR
jgi:glutamate dehydrogenase (NAD(P)+)